MTPDPSSTPERSSATTRRAIRAALDEAALLPAPSPSTELKIEEAVDKLERVFMATLRGEREARAADRMALRGEAAQLRREVADEKIRRRAAEHHAAMLEAELLKEGLERRLFHRETVERAEETRQLGRHIRDQGREVRAVHREARRARHLASLAIVGVFVLALALGSWTLLTVTHVSAGFEIMILGSSAVAGTALASLVIFGWRVALRVVSLAGIAINAAGALLEIITRVS